MSIESAKLFLERVKSNAEFAKQVAEIKDQDSCMAFVKNAGFDFTDAEIAEVMGELSDGELDAVVGGVGEGPVVIEGSNGVGVLGGNTPVSGNFAGLLAMTNTGIIGS